MIIKMEKGSATGELWCNSEVLLIRRWVLWFNVKSVQRAYKIVIESDKWLIENTVKKL